MTCPASAPRCAVWSRPLRRALALLWVAALVLTVLAVTSRSAWAQAAKTIDINAQIHVTVADEADVSGDFRVDPDGNITMLYVNQVPVAGLTPEQAATRLASKKYLGKFYKHPQVVVSITNPGGITVTVSGQVTAQKDYTVRSDTHLNEVILLASPSVDADLANVQVTSGLPGEQKVKRNFNYLLYRDKNDEAGNPLLHDGDLIYLAPKTAAPIEVTLLGDFGKSGKVPFPANTTVFEAIQETGGLTLTVKQGSFAIQHAGSTVRIPFDYQAARQDPSDRLVNPVLQDGDTLTSESQATTTNTYTIIGAVRSPGKVPLSTPYTTLGDAIGTAGGLNGGSRLRETTITRLGADGKPQTIHLDATDPTIQASTRIYPGDNVNIPQGRPGFSPDPLTVISALGSIVGLAFLFRH